MMRYTISLASASLLALAAPSAVLAEVPRVVTDIIPVQSLVAQVMGDLGTPEVLLAKGGDAHDFQLRPSQAAALADAGLVVWVGPQMTPWLDRTMDGLSGGAQLELLGVAGTLTRQFAGHDDHDDHDHGAEAEAGHEDPDHAAETGQDDHDHAEEAGHDDHAEGAADEHGHHHTGTDPHAWLDPANAQVWLTAIAAELSQLDPENAPTYAANAATASDRIAALDAGISARLAPVRDKPFMVFHDAYGYLADHYGLTVAGTVAAGDAAAPGAAHLAALQAGLANGATLCIFPEANHDPKLLAALSEGTGVRVGGALDPEGAAVDPGPGAYAAIMERLADTLVACLAAD